MYLSPIGYGECSVRSQIRGTFWSDPEGILVGFCRVLSVFLSDLQGFSISSKSCWYFVRFRIKRIIWLDPVPEGIWSDPNSASFFVDFRSGRYYGRTQWVFLSVPDPARIRGEYWSVPYPERVLVGSGWYFDRIRMVY